jgi:hypothetical protein
VILLIVPAYAFSKRLDLTTEVMSALTISFGMAVQYFFQQHDKTPKQPNAPSA